MWRQFTSSSVHKVDGKGRVSVPAVFRKVLEGQGAEGQVFLVPGFRDARAIEGYAFDGHAAIGAQIARMHPASKPRKRLEHRFLGRTLPLQLDENGRIVLSPALRQDHGIAGQAQFVGLGDSFQIWAPEAYEAYLAELDDDDEEDAFAAMPWPGDAPGGAQGGFSGGFSGGPSTGWPA
ncbi:MAG: cell division/cell wall cluster transcriptional repressor MraZ [Pseudomonadota bacterium]